MGAWDFVSAWGFWVWLVGAFAGLVSEPTTVHSLVCGRLWALGHLCVENGKKREKKTG